MSSPPDPSGDPPLPPSQLGALREALELSLRREPSGPVPPPELGPLLGLPVPAPAKCRFLDGSRLLRDNLRGTPGSTAEALGKLRTALNILEKYGRNLLQPQPPRHWRSVRYGNPVFRSTVGAIQGGRGVLCLLGYTEEVGEGLQFPEGTPSPDLSRVAAVTADLLVLRGEIDLLLANQHPNPQFFTDILEGKDEGSLVSDSAPTGERAGPTGGTSSGPHSDPDLGSRAWSCPSCTFLNAPLSVLCGVCDRPRLARPPPPGPTHSGWACPHCTYQNVGGALRCDVCHCPPEATPTAPEALPICKEAPPTPPGTMLQRQQRMREDGKRVVELFRAAEAQGLPVEAVVGRALVLGRALGAGPAVAQAWVGLGAELRALAGGVGPEAGGGAGAPLSLREAAEAWVHGRANPARARSLLIGCRKKQLRLLLTLGFGDPAESGAALFHNAGDQWGALRDLQRGRLQPFLRRLWEPEPELDFDGDQQPLVRRILATLGVASWGRALLVASLGQELGLGRVPRTGRALVELVEAVGCWPDRDRVLRVLRCECAVCGWGLPRHQALSLTGCQCPLCPECFRGHFRVSVRERGVRDLCCPACARPDLTDDSLAPGYFATLDVQLRQYLDPATYQLFTQKLTELELMKDPKFIWCIQCSFGFIFEAEQGPAQCPQCHQSFCPRCQRTWDPQHSSLSCAEFLVWLGVRDPQAAAVGLGAFLRENGIACPRCGVCYALARGGCIHFQCSQCRHQFCSGCREPFHPKDTCPDPDCPLRGSLHGHHPRDCLFYLRDWDPSRLQRLLREEGVPFDTEPPPGAPPVPEGGCRVLEQKETPAGLRDQPCGRETLPGHAGLCRGHYTEYLVSRINAAALDPARLYDLEELLVAAQRHLPAGRPPPLPGEPQGLYEQRLRGLLAREAPIRLRPLAGPAPTPGLRPTPTAAAGGQLQ